MSYAIGKQRGWNLSIEAAVGLAKTAIEFLSAHRLFARWLLRSCGQAAITIFFGLIVLAGYHVVREGSFERGIHIAFFDTNQDILERDRQTEIAVTQARIGQDATANRVIDQLLTNALTPASNGARIRLAVIHNGIAGVTNISMLRADITNAIARPGRATGDLSVNLPMGSLATFSPAMLDGSCWQADTSSLSYNPGREHLERVGVKTFLACPVKDPNNLLLGEIAMHWDRGDTVPEGADMTKLVSEMKFKADQIGAIISLRASSYSKATHPSD